MADINVNRLNVPFPLNVVRGFIPGFTVMNKFGRNVDVDAGNDEDVWDGSGTYPWLSSAVTLTIDSTDANDAAAGTGARTIRIFGLDSSWNEQTEDITMNGVTGVNTVNTYRRIYRMYALTAGSGETNDGRINASNGGTIYASIRPEVGQTLMALYTIPNGKTGYLTEMGFGIVPAGGAAANLEGEIHLHIRPDGGAWRTLGEFGVSTKSGFQRFPWEYPNVLEAKTDIVMAFHSHDNNVEVNGVFTILLEND